MPIFGFVGATVALFISSSKKHQTPTSNSRGWPLDVGRSALDVFFLAALIDCHVLVVLLQLVSVFGDLNGFRIEDANRHVITVKFNRTI